MIVALPSGHALAKADDGRGAALTLTALAEETFILFGDPPHGDWLLRNNAFFAACQRAGFSPRVGQVVPHLTARLNLIAAGLGVAVVASSLRNVRIEGVSFRPLKGAAQLKAPLSLASRRGDSSPVVQQFLKLAKRTAKSFSDEATPSLRSGASG